MPATKWIGDGFPKEVAPVKRRYNKTKKLVIVTIDKPHIYKRNGSWFVRIRKQYGPDTPENNAYRLACKFASAMNWNWGK